MKTPFLSAALTLLANAAGVYWKRLSMHLIHVLDKSTIRADQPQAARANSAEAVQEALLAAKASMAEKFTAIMVRLERIEGKVDLLPSRR